MGWGRTLLLGDIGNRLDIDDVERSISRLRSKLSTQSRTDQAQDQRLAALELENDQLKMYLASLMRLLVSRNVVAEDEIAAFVDVIDVDEKA